MSRLGFAAVLVCLLAAGPAATIQAATITSAGSGSWHATTTWSGGILPGELDSVVIAAGHVVTVERDTSAQAIYILVTSGRNGIDITSGVTLAVTNRVTVGASSTSVSGTSEMRVGGGILTAAGLSINGYTLSSSYSKGLVSVGTGTITVSGDITFNNSYSATLSSSGASRINIGGNLASGGILTTSGTGTIVFNGSGAQTVGAYTTYNNVTVDKSAGTATLGGACTFGGNLTVSNGTFSTSSSALTVAGNLDVSGTMSGTGIITLSGTGRNIYGTFSYPSLTVSGTYTNNGDLTVSSALSGTGGLTNAAGASLTIGGTSGITTLTASAVGNTVTYNGAGQTIKAVTYHHLTLGGSGTKTITGLSTVNGNLTVTGSASATATVPLTVGGNLTVSGTAVLADGGFQITGNSAGQLTVGPGASLTLGAGGATATTFPLNYTAGNITLTGSTVTYNTTAALTLPAVPATYGNLTLTGASTKTVPASTPLTIGGNLVITTSGGVLADGGNTITVTGNVTGSGTHSGAGKILLAGGSAQHTISVPGCGNLELADVQGAVTGAAVTVSGNLTIASGTFTVGAFALTVNGATSITGTFATASATGTKTFTGDVTVNSGGTWNNAGNAAVSCAGSFTNNSTSTFTAGTGVYTFSGSGKSISSVIPLSIPSLTVNGTVTNTANLTVATALAGTGTLTNGTGATLTIGGTSGITTLTASAVPNTVVYNGTSAQTIKGATYHHLTVNTTGTATLGAATVVNGTLSVASGTTLALSSSNLTVNGDFTNVNGATISQASSGAMTVTGTYVNNGTHTQNSTGGLSAGTFTNNNAYNATTSSNTLTVTGLFTNSATGVITRSNTGVWNLAGGFTNASGGQYTHSGTGDMYVTGNLLNDGLYATSGASGLSVTGNFTNSGSITKTAAGEDTVAGLFWNKPTGSFTRGATSTGHCWLRGGFLNEGAYTATAAASPLVVGVAATGGDFTNNGTFDNSGNGPLTFHGNFTNNQTYDAPASFGTGLITFGGTGSNTAVASATSLTFASMAVSKAAGRWLSLNADLTLSGTAANVLNLTAGNLLVNGTNLSVPNGATTQIVNGAAACTLRISPSLDRDANPTVTLGNSATTIVSLNQASGGLGAVIVDGGTLNIYGRHALYHSATAGQNCFVLNGGTVTYYYAAGTTTNSSLVLTTAGTSVGAGTGWYAYGGTVDFKGNIYCYQPSLASNYVFRFQAPGAIVKFSGTAAGSFNGNSNASYAVVGQYHLGGVRVEKTSNTVVFTAAANIGNSFVEMDSLIVNSGATLDLTGTFNTNYGYRVNGNVTNNGGITRSAGSNNNLVITGNLVNNNICSNSVASGLTVNGDFTNNGTFTQTAAGTVTVSGLTWNKSGKTIERNASSTGQWNLNGGFTNDGTYTATTAASPLTLGASSPFIQSGTGQFTNGAGAVQFGSTFSNSGVFTTTGAGNVTFAGLATNNPSGTMERATGSTGTYTFNAGFTNNGTFKNTTTTAGFTVNGAFNNGSTATFTNPGNSNLQFNGDFANEQATASWGTGTVVFGGTTDGSFSGGQEPVFARMQVNKTGAPLPALTLRRNLTVPDLVMTSGYLNTNGYNLTVNDSLLGAAAGILNITSSALTDAASTVNVATLHQGATTGIGQVLVAGAGATLNITGQHVLNYGGAVNTNYFLLSGTGATVNYQNASGTGNSASLVLTTSSGTNAATCGWFATAGTVNFYGNIYSPYSTSSAYRQFFQASSGATLRFVGSSASEVNLAVTYAPSAGYAVWDFGTMQVAKTGAPAPAVTFTSSISNCAVVVGASGGATVNANNTLRLQGQFAGGSYGYNFSGGLLNNGTVERVSSPVAANNHVATGAFTNNGVFRANANTANLTVNGNFLNAATATFDNTANGNLTFNGNFRNDQADPAKAIWSTSAGTNTVTFGGAGSTTVRHASPLLTLDCNVAVDKGAIDRTVTLESGINLQQAGRTLTITSGTLVTNGNHLYVYQSAGAITGGSAGRLNVTGASNVSVMNLNQGSGQLKEVVLEGSGTFVIEGTHTLHYSSAGNKFVQSGTGTVNYNGTGTGTSSGLYLTSGSVLLSPPDTSGWLVSSGTINFFGAIYAAHGTAGNATVFRAQSPGVVRFIGTQAGNINLAGTVNSTGSVWSIDDLRIQKSSNSLTITSTAAMSAASFAAGSLTVNSGSTLYLGGSFGSGYGYDLSGNITNNGAITMQTGTNNNLYVGGNWSGTGSFTASGKAVTFDHPGAATVTLPSGSAFYDLTANKGAGGSLALSGNAQVANILRVQSGTFSVGQNTLTMGTAAGAGQVIVDATATFSAVGVARSDCGQSTENWIPDTGTDALAQVVAASEAYPYGFTVNSGATIAARYAAFTKPGTSGIVVKSGATIAPAPNNFSNCQFDHGGISGPMLRLENNEAHTITGAVFNGTAAEGVGFNISKPQSASGRIDVAGGSGTRWGSRYEQDPAELIYWKPGLDAACIQVFAPTGFVDSGATVVPSCSVYNMGLNPATFVVRMNIGGNMAVRNYTVNNLAPDAGLRVNFSNWVADVTPGTYQVRCSTRLTGDQEELNNRQGPYNIMVVKRDVRVHSILAPVGSYKPGEEVQPEAVWANDGNVPGGADFEAWMIILDPTGTERYRKKEDVHVPERSQLQIQFADKLTLNLPGDWTVRCSTGYDDMIPSNNVMVRVFTVTSTNVGVKSVASPVPGARYAVGAEVTPSATWRNYGESSADFDAWMIITGPLGERYAHFRRQTGLGPGEDRVVSDFPVCVFPSAGTWNLRCSTYYADDNVPADDTLDRQFSVVDEDVAAISVTTPIPGRAYLPGAEFVPAATWRNNSALVPADFWAWMMLSDPNPAPAGGAGTDESGAGTDAPAYRDSVLVTGLAPGKDTLVQFRTTGQLWAGGAWTVRCSTRLADDPVPENDTLSAFFSIGLPDMSVNAILAPTDTVQPGKTVIPSARVQNKGNCIVTFDVRFTMWDPTPGTDAEAYDTTLTIPGLTVDKESTLTFPSFVVSSATGTWVTRCSVYVAADRNTEDNVRYGSFRVEVPEPSPWEPGMGLAGSLPGMQTPDKAPQAGAWLAVAPNWEEEPESDRGSAGSSDPHTLEPKDPVIYVAKGNKTGDFGKYDPLSNTWTERKKIPEVEDGKLKPPSKGTVGIAAPYDTAIYLTRGNNTLGFYRYDIKRNDWDRLANVPVNPDKKKNVKGGNDLAYVYRDDTNWVYLLKGGLNEFYRYNVEAERWDTMENVPYTGTSSPKYDKGSFLAYDGGDYIYAHRAKYNDGKDHYMFRFDLRSETWNQTPLKGMPLNSYEGGALKKKKVGDGAAGVWFEGRMYAVKGGGTHGFFRYSLPDTWEQIDTVPRNGPAGKKAVKAGGDIVYWGKRTFFLLKGNKCAELWRYVVPALGASGYAAQASGAQAQAQAQAAVLRITPNPIANGFATVRLATVGRNPGQSPAQVRVFDAAGRCVLQHCFTPSPHYSASLDLRKLSAGIYLVRLDTEGFSATQKLVVQSK